jgi:hypothetical protein
MDLLDQGDAGYAASREHAAAIGEDIAQRGVVVGAPEVAVAAIGEANLGDSGELHGLI